MRRDPKQDNGVAKLIRDLNQDRSKLRDVLVKIEAGDCPMIENAESRKWVERDWLIAQLKAALP